MISDNIQDSTDAMYDKSRKTGVTNSLARYDMGLSTIMGKSNQDAGGHILDAAMRSRMERLRRWDHRIKTSTFKIETSGMPSINFTHQKTNLGYLIQ